MEVVTDAVPSNPLPEGNPKNPLGEDSNNSRAGNSSPTPPPQDADAGQTKKNFKSSKAKYFSDGSPKIVNNISISGNNVHLGSTYSIYMNHDKSSKKKASTGDERPPDFVKDLMNSARKVTEKDLNIISMNLSVKQGLENLAHLLDIPRSQIDACSFEFQDAPEVIYQTLKYWKTINSKPEKGVQAMLSTLCNALWHEDVRANGGKECLMELAKAEEVLGKMEQTKL